VSQKIQVLGTGNAFLPQGRLHSLTLIDGQHLIDAPPTVLASLRQANVPVSDIRTIFVTHLHGDHIFGFPFLLLERKYISDRDGIKPLRVVVAPGGKEILHSLCTMAYPGSLDEIFNSIDWQEQMVGEVEGGLRWKKFHVQHVDEVDPYGYRFDYPQFSFVHSGDSGPCESLYSEIQNVDFVILEMGVPDYVETDEHHSPSSIQALAERFSTPLVITHTYIDEKGINSPAITVEKPLHPSHVHHASDGFTCFWSDALGSVQFSNRS
jgi:ribonuclease BN (tRNA processing enzyme)